MLCPRLRFRFSATLLFESEVCTWTRNLVINRDLCSQNRDPNKKGWLASAKLKKITRTAWIWVQLCHNDCPLVWSLKPGWHPNPTKLTVKSWHLTEIRPPIKESYENDISVVFLAPCELIMQIINSMVVLMASSDKLCTDPGFELQITPTVPHSLFKSHMKNIIWRRHTYLNFPSAVQCRSFHPLFLPTSPLKSWSAQGPLKWIVSRSIYVTLEC